MKLDIENIDEIVQNNNLPQVTNPIYTNRDKQPTEDGLFSYTFFGMPGSLQRRFQYGYVDLKKRFMHPVVYNLMTKMDRRIIDIVSGVSYFRVSKEGLLIADQENGETGLSFLYDNYDKLKFAETGAKSRKDKIGLLSEIKRDDAFVKSFLIIPCVYRDIDLNTESGMMATDEISDMYKRLISLTNSIKNVDDVFTGDITNSKIQAILMELYVMFGNKLAKKRGIIQRNLLGKTVDYGVRGVLSTPRLDSQTYDKQRIPYGTAGIPLHLCASAFFPFVAYHLENMLSSFKGHTLKLTLPDQGIDVINESIDTLTTKTFEKLIGFYARSVENRNTVITVLDSDGKSVPVYGHFKDKKFTITDMLYLATSEAVANKHIALTRYPLEDFLNIVPLRPVILTTEKIENVQLGNTNFPSYPITEGSNVKWIDSVIPNNGIIVGLGADYDGDMVSVKGIFTQESNAEMEALIKSKSTLLTMDGNHSRGFSKEGVLSLHSMTM